MSNRATIIQLPTIVRLRLKLFAISRYILNRNIYKYSYVYFVAFYITYGTREGALTVESGTGMCRGHDTGPFFQASQRS